MAVTIRKVTANENLGRKIDSGKGWINGKAPADGVEFKDGDSRILMRLDDLRELLADLDGADAGFKSGYDFWRDDGTP